MNEKIKVLYIAGNGRSGSTLVGIILGQLEGFFSVGELRRVWERGLIQGSPCACGSPFRQCGVWQNIFKDAYGGMDNVDAARLLAFREQLTQTKHLPGMFVGTNRKLKEYAKELEPLYAAVQRATGSRVIIDASKWPMYGHLLDLMPSIDLYILHLVRDPRASAFSWARVKEYEPGSAMPRQGAIRSTLYWLAWNPAIRYFWNRKDKKYLFMKYEDFASAPRTWVLRIANFLQEPVALNFFNSENGLVLKRTHAVAGNEARLREGGITIAEDAEWRLKLPASKRRIVSAMSWPLLYRYGYFGHREI